jgi:hypothetical protein
MTYFQQVVNSRAYSVILQEGFSVLTKANALSRRVDRSAEAHHRRRVSRIRQGSIKGI